LDDAAVIYKPQPPVSRKLDRYKGIIQARLQLYPRLTAQRENSYRMREHTDLWHAIQPKAEEQSNSSSRQIKGQGALRFVASSKCAIFSRHK
jgi:hypothetical protein